MLAALVATALATGAGAAATAALPPELASLPALLDEPQRRLLDSVRRFDQLQCALADWDLEVAWDLGQTGDRDLAKMKQQRAADRLAVVRAAYEFVLAHERADPRTTNEYAELLYRRFGETDRAVRRVQLSCLEPGGAGDPRRRRSGGVY